MTVEEFGQRVFRYMDQRSQEASDATEEFSRLAVPENVWRMHILMMIGALGDVLAELGIL
jgi:hypothetical protein